MYQGSRYGPASRRTKASIGRSSTARVPGPSPARGAATPRAGSFPAQAYRDSATTSLPGATSRFGCHSSTRERPLICAGRLLRGAQHHDQVQQALADGTLASPELPDGIELYGSYQDMAAANGVDPDPYNTCPLPLVRRSPLPAPTAPHQGNSSARHPAPSPADLTPAGLTQTRP
nr:DUF6283 family protein [Streptomyces sp. SID4948]